MKLLMEGALEMEANEALLDFAGVNSTRHEPPQALSTVSSGSDLSSSEIDRLAMNLDFISASVSIPVVEGRPLPGYARLDYPDPLGSGAMRKIPIVDGLLPPGISSASLMGRIVQPVVRMLSVRSLPKSTLTISISGVPGNTLDDRTPFRALLKSDGSPDVQVLSEKSGASLKSKHVGPSPF